MPPVDERARELNQSGFVSLRGGAAFGGLAYLLVAGLFVVYFGATQGEDGDTVEPTVVAVGWLAVALATLGNIVMLCRFVRFLKAVRTWTRSQVERDPATASRPGLEVKLTRRGGRSSPGPAGEFVLGALALVPFGLVLPFVALLVLVISVADAFEGAGGSGQDAIFLAAALVAVVLAFALESVVVAGISLVGMPLVTWRRAGRAARGPGHPSGPHDRGRKRHGSGWTHD